MREREHQKGIRKAWFGTCKELSSTDQLSIVPTEKVGFFKHTLASCCPPPGTFRVLYPFNNISFSAKKPLDPAYPAVISTIGDHIRTRRLDLGLFQKEAADRIGVDTNTITNWELNRSEPRIQYLQDHRLPGVCALLPWGILSRETQSVSDGQGLDATRACPWAWS